MLTIYQLVQDFFFHPPCIMMGDLIIMIYWVVMGYTGLLQWDLLARILQKW
jgi:hypothetical protein